MDIIRKQVSTLKLSDSQLFELLDLRNKQVIDTLLESRDLVTENLSKQTQLLIQSDRAEHLKTQSTILAVAETKTARSIQSHLLQSLKFQAMTERREEICEAHHKTFEWIFHDPLLSGKPWSNFVDWLQRGSGVYWINGKAGSGKSTLMREIVRNPKTRENIDLWSAGEQTKTVSFFFWNSGTTLQRSQIGLFRSLLYEALKDQPDLVAIIFPQELQTASREVEQGTPFHEIEWNWPLKKLQQAFARLTTFATASMKFCFFIDGLDEYEGDHESLAGFFKSLSSMSHVKLCISSRPWLTFEDSFKGYPGLKLQDLTFDDIVAYVSDELQDHHRMLQLAKQAPSHASELVNEIVTKANGVFLWVKLVVRSLLKGLGNGDDISDLRRRLKDLPADLGAFYKHMMDQIEPIYRQQAAQIFRIYDAMMAVQGSSGQIDPLELSLAVTASPSNDLCRTWEPMELGEVQLRCERLNVYLKSRCAGLLEITKLDHIDGGSEGYLKVSYLHRTVKDFLDTEDVRTTLLLDASSIPDFEPNTWVLMSYITRLRRFISPKFTCTFSENGTAAPMTYYTGTAYATDLSDDHVYETGHRALKYAINAEKAGDKLHIAMIDALDRTIAHLWPAYYATWQSLDQSKESYDHYPRDAYPTEWQSDIFTKAVTLNLYSYIETKLLMDATVLISKSGLSLLEIALSLGHQNKNFSVEMVEILLRYGADPNQASGKFTTWQRSLDWVHTQDWDIAGPISSAPYFELTRWASVFKLLLQHGANPYATCRYKHESKTGQELKSHKVADVITDIFDSRLPHEASELRYILQKHTKARDNLTTTQAFFRYDENRMEKRKFSRFKEQEPHKRRPYSNQLHYNTPTPLRDRFMHSVPRRSRYSSRSTRNFRD
jgi:hypothetical protein